METISINTRINAVAGAIAGGEESDANRRLLAESVLLFAYRFASVRGLRGGALFDADDFAQTVCLKTLKAVGRYRPDVGLFTTYLHKVCQTTGMDMFSPNKHEW
ncbi:MAG: hypothetical protein A2Z34_01420 [Planctomycetes bacterium RBG_16_59_8]|nr:MAG: hypothetical protein A2Z34_01420 [Planctomycetes bacterium RBG_16_59_8]